MPALVGVRHWLPTRPDPEPPRLKWAALKCSAAAHTRLVAFTAFGLVSLLFLFLQTVPSSVTVTTVVQAPRPAGAAARHTTAAAAAPVAPPSPPLPDVVVCYSGYLNLPIPGRGSLARRYMVDVLKADVIVSGRYVSMHVCMYACMYACMYMYMPLKADVIVSGSYGLQDRCLGRCLWEKLAALEPIAARSLSPKLTNEAISKLVRQMPRFAEVERAFHLEQTI